ncbi:uncharacterized protein LOC109823481 [Asparagus officinalis]|uniref:uncharacterized protein LOC109823481 n=1 Tax=Asparagus officinalis TaxID=4686 RepID=UPI00098E6998|nr:uncharacterized protein LOC109823481 [Asparagus officinalis]
MGVVRPYPIEWDTIPYLAKFKPISLTEFLTGNDAILTRLFIGTLNGVAFEWFCKLEPGSITSWADAERHFLARFFDDDTEVSMATLLVKKQRKSESVKDFVKRFRNRSVYYQDQVSEATLIEMCRNNFLIHILSKDGAVETQTWKELVLQGELVENMIKRLEAEEPHPKKGAAELNAPKNSPQSRGKEIMAIDSAPAPKSAQRLKPRPFEQIPPRQYDFKEDQVVANFNTLLTSNRIKLPKATKPEEADKTGDPSYNAYHRFLGHHTFKCYILKDKLQVLYDAGVLKKENVQKKVTTNMITLSFGRISQKFGRQQD